ncbi:sigma-70 family RNA polymerase sigma factor [Methylobacterium planeticum]|uniref:Sigma-70 family RNA polymerase sigma factor n=1 Tax=Methylobacterium planeticum TaxID=2615211 RepID=A0A6N6MWV7_9HYPH|nr:sigma-70 family RNA polymerase sigma factor [Methylobacterium planeticum]KAB1074424.1 sigma-70 family RNA polymerase sigma factor [Methylobacterium planeticum]
MPDEAGTDVFEAHRARLLRLAYRMLGSVAEAEDVVQNAWLRWWQVDHAGVEAPPAFLSRIVTRLCLDAMKSARARRETYVGSWLPEPLVEMPEEGAVAGDDLTLTLMMALERLSPLERAAFLLHDVFGLPLGEVAATLDRDPAAVRQLAVRARRHVQADRPRYPVAREEGDRIAEAFFAASRSGDLGALRTMLSDGVVMRSDGGGKVHAFPNPIAGAERILRLFRGLARKAVQPATFLRAIRVDGLPGFASLERGGVLQVTALAVENGKVAGIFITRNPDKLRHVARALGLPPPATPLH